MISLLLINVIAKYVVRLLYCFLVEHLQISDQEMEEWEPTDTQIAAVDIGGTAELMKLPKDVDLVIFIWIAYYHFLKNVPLRYISSNKQLEKCVEVLKDEKILAFDTEV